MSYRVDNVPRVIYPFYILFSYALGLAIFVWLSFLNVSCKIQIVGLERLPQKRNYIYCSWHHNTFGFFIVHILDRFEDHAWLNHPAWHMKPIHIVIQMMSVKHLILGSSGSEGKIALAQLVEFLKAGYSTWILPDGPAGPQEMKDGALLASALSGVPIVPIRFEMSRSIRVPGSWDGKRIPLPFSSVRLIYEDPVLVTEQNFELARKAVSAAMG